MILRELLAELRHTILRDFSSAVDASPSEGANFDDNTLVRYIREAELRFATKTRCLRDSTTPAVCQITLVAGQAEYALDSRVMTVHYARYDGRINLGPIGYTNEFTPRGDLAPSAPTAYASTQGEPRFFYTDSGTGKIGFYPAPSTQDAGKIVTLTVTRKPLVPLSTQNLDQSPEIPEEYHLDLLGWAAWKLMSTDDTEYNGDPNSISVIMARQNMFKKQFNDAVDECKTQVRRLTQRPVAFATPGANWS